MTIDLDTDYEDLDLILDLLSAHVTEKFIAVEEAVGDQNTALAAEKYVQWKQMVEAIEDFNEQLTKDNEKIKTELVPSVFRSEDFGASSITTNSGFRVTVSSKIYASAKGEKKKEAKDWLRSNDAEHCIVEQINASSLSSHAKELSEQNMELPDDLFNKFVKDTMSVTKVKPKKGK